MSPVGAEARERILQDVEQWLDRLEEPEPAPAGIQPETLEAASDEAPDLFTLLGALTALAREVQLGGRTTYRLHGEITATLARFEQIGDGREQNAREVAEARRETRREIALELVGLRERLARAIGEAGQALRLRRFLARLAFGRIVESLVEGNRLTLDRLDELLCRLEVREIPAAAQPFDPLLMRAVETSADAAVAPGTVARVVRAGYLFGDQVLRHAEVAVRPANVGGNK